MLRPLRVVYGELSGAIAVVVSIQPGRVSSVLSGQAAAGSPRRDLAVDLHRNQSLLLGLLGDQFQPIVD